MYEAYLSLLLITATPSGEPFVAAQYFPYVTYDQCTEDKAKFNGQRDDKRWVFARCFPNPNLPPIIK